ncbi:MAG: glutaredoxin 3 [Pseudomonadota bacterium]
MSENHPTVVMYATGLCGFCSAAKRLLSAKGVEFETIRVDQDAAQKEIMMERSGRRTVPQIFIGDHHVGGFDDLYELDSDGELDALLQIK